jgi:hypothetical protein
VIHGVRHGAPPRQVEVELPSFVSAAAAAVNDLRLRCCHRGLSDRPFPDGRRYVALAAGPCGAPAVVSTGECLRCCDAAADRQARRHDLDALDDL